MKKFVALLLALTLVVVGVVSAMASPDKWVDVDLEGYKVVYLFNYNESVAVNTDGKTVTWGVNPDYKAPSSTKDSNQQYSVAGEATMWASDFVAMEETFPHSKNPDGTPVLGKDPAWDTRYVISSTFVAGFEANEVVGNGSTLNVVPVDIADCEENTAYVYPVATKSHVVIGLLFAKVNVEEGYIQVEVQYKDELYKDWGTTLTVYTTKAQLIDGSAANFELAAPISIEEELGGAPAVLISIAGKVTYPTLFGPMWSTKKKDDGTTEKVPGKFYAYQDYFRFEKWVKTYRTNMTAALALVAD